MADISPSPDAKGSIREIILPKGLDLDRPKRTRTSFTAEQLYRLEMEFQRCQYVVGRERTELARQLNLSETQVPGGQSAHCSAAGSVPPTPQLVLSHYPVWLWTEPPRGSGGDGPMGEKGRGFLPFYESSFSLCIPKSCTPWTGPRQHQILSFRHSYWFPVLRICFLLLLYKDGLFAYLGTPIIGQISSHCPLCVRGFTQLSNPFCRK